MARKLLFLLALIPQLALAQVLPSIERQATAGGSGTPGGSSGELQYNNGGSFDGVSSATSDGTKLFITSIFGGGTTSDDLDVYANDETFDDQNTGRIRLHERIVIDDALTMTGSGGVVNSALLDFSSVVTTANSINLFPLMRDRSTWRLGDNQLLSSMSSFQGTPLYIQEVSGSESDLVFYSAGYFRPKSSPDLSSGSVTDSFIAGAISGPTLGREDVGTITSVVHGYTTYSDSALRLFLSGAYDIGGNSTAEVLAHYGINNPTVAAGSGITEHVGLLIPSLTAGSSATKGVSSGITSGSGKWNFYASGDANNALAGALRIGDTTAPTQKLEVLGNALIDNSGTAGELRFREPSGSGSNYTAFKAQAQSGNVTYTLPAADGSSGHVLQTNGSGTLSWASAPAGSLTTAGTTCITSPVTMTTANTFYDGPSLSLSAGTWLVTGHATMTRSATTITAWTCKLWDGTTVTTDAEATNPSQNPHTKTIHLSGLVAPGSTTTYKISCTATTSSNTLNDTAPDNGATDKASCLTAIKVG